jgi:lysophospholipid acyltransferase (LPLAT)-like uncharacterized protein
MKRFFYRHIFPRFLIFFVRSISLTLRVKVENEGYEKRILERGHVPIYCSWHQRFFAGISFFSLRPPVAVMVSRSRDGDLIARILEILGFHTARGSSSRGGGTAFQKLRRFLKRGIAVGHMVDGPRGPFGDVKPGLIRLAQLSGMPILPILTSPEKKWVLKSWDKFMIPKPFSRILVRFEEEIYIRPDLTADEFEESRVAIEKDLHCYYETMDKRWKDLAGESGYDAPN